MKIRRAIARTMISVVCLPGDLVRLATSGEFHIKTDHGEGHSTDVRIDLESHEVAARLSTHGSTIDTIISFDVDFMLDLEKALKYIRSKAEEAEGRMKSMRAHLDDFAALQAKYKGLLEIQPSILEAGDAKAIGEIQLQINEMQKQLPLARERTMRELQG